MSVIIREAAYESNISLLVPVEKIVGNHNSFLKNLIITKIGFFGKAYGHYIKRERIDEYILIYCISGKGWVELGTEKWEIAKGGDCILCEKSTAWLRRTSGRPLANPLVAFSGEGVPELISMMHLPDDFPRVSMGEDPELITLMKKAYKALSVSHSLPNLLLDSTCLQEIFCHIIKSRTIVGKGTSIELKMESIIQYMMRNIRQVISLENFDEYVQVSKYHFVRRFKEITGYTPIKYFNRLIMQKACDLLEASSMNIKEISEG